MVVEDIMHVRCEEGQMLKENYLKNNSLKFKFHFLFLKKSGNLRDTIGEEKNIIS